MSQSDNSIKRFAIIAVTLLIMAGGVTFVGEKIRNSHAASESKGIERLKPMELVAKDRLKPGRVSFTTPDNMSLPAGAKQRTLKDFYALRAYPGAPPVIPHPVTADQGQQQSCNACHEKGGYVPKYNAFTPITPHPEYKNCMQCHAMKTAQDNFRGIDWPSPKTPAIKRASLPGGPPPMPHKLDHRENCAACHTGPAAPLEIRCSHPERLNCIQCHALKTVEENFSRSLPDVEELTK
jgi:nitrate reductase cytochrome c-type subunit